MKIIPARCSRYILISVLVIIILITILIIVVVIKLLRFLACASL